MSLAALFEPRGVAVVGSMGEGKIGRVLVDQLVSGGFSPVYAVNPRADGAPGVAAAARSVGELAAAGHLVDLVVVASPAETVAATFDDAGRAGVRAAAVITAGFSEVGEREREAELVRVARRHGIRFLGPNCAGLVNTKRDLFPTLETRPPRGDVAFVSQSGALGGAVLSWAEEQGLGFSKFVSYGNGADLNEIDLLDALSGDDETRVIALYLETVSDGRAFLAAAERAASRKPLVVIKSGRSAAGGRATLSHTGSLAGADAVYDAALRQCGALRVRGIEELFDVCRGFVSLPPVRGKRLAIVTNSGGPGVLAADAATAAGLDVAPPSESLTDRLRACTPPLASLGNPIDLTVQGGEDAYRDALVAALAELDAALAIDVNVPYLDAAPIARGVVAAARTTGKPVAASFLAGKTVASALPVLVAGGVPNFATGERAVDAISRIAMWTADAARPPASVPAAAGELPGSDRVLAEPDALAWLAGEGLPVPSHRFAATADEAAAAARAFGVPVALKVVATGVVHKTDVGGVALGVASADEAKRAFAALAARASGVGFRGALVVPMIGDAVEVLVGVTRDRQFGPVVAVGLGGTAAEALADVALRVAPIDADEAAVMLQELRGAALLGAFRGRPPRDVRALAALVAHVSELPFRYPDLEELDLNPVFSLEHGALVGDARAVRATRGPSAQGGCP
ncbi:MAG: acetate--CoA ligase family protein [Candidatus Bipolaricaulota bacterium]